MGISIAPVSVTQAKYYTNAVAKGKEDYYSGLGEAPPTRFSGRADGIFETPDVVPVDSVAEMFKLQGKDDHRKIVAFDLTCSVLGGGLLISENQICIYITASFWWS